MGRSREAEAGEIIRGSYHGRLVVLLGEGKLSDAAAKREARRFATASCDADTLRERLDHEMPDLLKHGLEHRLDRIAGPIAPDHDHSDLLNNPAAYWRAYVQDAGGVETLRDRLTHTVSLQDPGGVSRSRLSASVPVS